MFQGEIEFSSDKCDSSLVMSEGHQGICKAFASGKYCRFGKHCRYLHFRKPKLNSSTGNDRHNGALRSYSDSLYSHETPLEHPAFFGESYYQYYESSNLNWLTQNTVQFENTTETEARGICKFYLNGFCAKGERCTYRHQKPLRYVDCYYNTDTQQYHEKKEEERRTSGSDESRSRICRHFRRGHCRYGETCKWSHEIPDIIEEDRTEGQNKTKSHDVAVDKTNEIQREQDIRPPVTVLPHKLQLEFPIEELSNGKNEALRDKEMTYFKKRFPQAKAVRDGVFEFVFRPSDPDWPYDVRCLNMCVNFPTEYPMKSVSITLTDNKQLPETVQRYIWKTIEEWLNDRFADYEKKGKAELVMRACVRWLDRNLEHIFTEGLKAYQRELMARAAGIEFVPASQLREEFAKRQSDSDGNSSENGEEEESDDSADDDDGYNDIANGPLVANPNHSQGLEATKKGTEVKLHGFQLKEQAASLIVERVSVIIQCGRCKNKTEFDTPPGRINVFGCAKCGHQQLATFRGNMAHQFSSVIGYLDMKDCGIHDIILTECNFKVGCLQCGRDMNYGGIIPGQLKESWCHSCHAKLVVAAESAKFLNLQPAELDVANALRLDIKKQKKLGKDPAIREGFPLPAEGICKHYKKSFRWFRFPCCGKAYPCDTCHDDNESHETEFANRMICGFCCKEQPFAADRPCTGCSSSLTKAKSSHWEGGKGCRDKLKMSRNDEAKYKNMNKTVSRKAQGKTSSTKNTKLRHA